MFASFFFAFHQFGR